MSSEQGDCMGNKRSAEGAPQAAENFGPKRDVNNPVRLRQGDALVIEDVQNDFLPGGSLPVPQGDAVIAPLNRCIAQFRGRGLPVIATRDWHPANHCSFQQYGGDWPPHCVVDSVGAEFAPDLQLPGDAWVIDKATDPDREAFSVFAVADFARQVRSRGIRRLFVGGLATEYCIRATVLDALKHRFRVVLLVDAVRAIDRQSGDGDHAIREMTEAGAEVWRSEDFAR